MSLYSELKRRNVLRVAIAYLAAAWLITEVSETIFPLFGYGDSPARIIVVLLAIGLPLFLIFSWVFEFTPEGLKLEKDVRRDESITPQTGKRIDRWIIVLLVAAVGYFAFDKFVLEPVRDEDMLKETAERARSEALVESYGDKSIAVLPFVNISADLEQEYFADGLTEELINLLASVPNLRVTARTSSFFFKGKDFPTIEIAEALNVSHLLEGSVRKDGNEVRINAQLIDAGSDTQVWSNSYDRPLDSIFAIQDDVANSISAALLESFEGLTVKTTERANSVAAYEAYRTGRLYWWRRSDSALQNALKLFSQAIELDPQFVPAYAAVADTWLLLALYGNVTTVDATQTAMPMIEKALELDSESVEALGALGLARWNNYQTDKAESALRRSVELNEDYIPAQMWLASLLGQQGRLSEEYFILQSAVQRDPLNELLMVNYAVNSDLRGDWQSARDSMRQLLSLRPHSTTLLRSMARQEFYNGNLVEGWKLASRAYQLQPDNPADIANLAQTWLLLGNTEEAERLLSEGLDNFDQNVGLLGAYWLTLLVKRRYEEAEGLVRQQVTQAHTEIPEEALQIFNFQLGLVAMLQGDYLSAQGLLISAITEEDDPNISRSDIEILTWAASASDKMGDAQTMAKLLQRLERAIMRWRLNGADYSGLYYSEAALLTLRGEYLRAIEKLRGSYNKGFRDLWSVENDPCLDSLRTLPEFQIIQDQIRYDINRARAEITTLLSATENPAKSFEQ